jgi:glucose-6-phosphate 1-dehydrogenase
VHVLEVVAELHTPPRMLFSGPNGATAPPNLVRLRLQPDAGVTFELLAKRPGEGDYVTTLPLAVDFRTVLGPVHAPYEQIFADALAGDPTHFARMDTLEQAWRIVGPALDSGTAPVSYPPGSWGPDTSATGGTEPGWQPVAATRAGSTS